MESDQPNPPGPLPLPAPPLSGPAILYVWLTALSAACLIIADMLGSRLFSIPLGFSIHVPWQSEPITALQHTCGMLTFPITFLVTDLVNDYFGKAAARRVAYLSAGMAVLSFVAINAAQALPHWDAPFNISDAAFIEVFGTAKVMYCASICAYIVGNILDIALFGWMKRATGNRAIWLRATGSTVVSQLLDSFVVTYLAFKLGREVFASGQPPMGWGDIFRTAATGYLLKFTLAVVLTPLLYVAHHAIKRYVGIEPLARDGK
ncbi:queuosine precursor transporter [soil metagenome]